MARELVIQAPDHAQQVVRLDGGQLSLGRAHGNDVSFPEDASLSRQHLVFEHDTDEDWTVRDLGSKNGTLLNGSRISSARTLKPGDRITAGRLNIQFRDPDAAEEGTVFVASDEAALSATVMTSLEGLLSGEGSFPTAPPLPGQEPEKVPSDEGARVFKSPVVSALIRAGRELAGHDPLDELFPRILDLSIEAVGAERGILMTFEGTNLKVRARHGEGFAISTAVRDRVLNEKTSVLVRDAQSDQAFRERLSISEQQIRTMMAVPLQTDKDVIGLIYVDSRFFVRDFTPDDLNLLTVLANVAAIRIEKSRLAEVDKELEQAANMQRRILPSRAPQIEGYEFGGHNAASLRVGGDYYDFLTYPDGRVGIVLADVAGKGMSAALLMSNLQARVQFLAELPHDSLSDMMHRLDRSISVHCPRNRFITMFMGLIDPATGVMTYCNAGHNPPALVRAGGDVEWLKGGGTVLGILPEVGYTEKTVTLEPGDMLALFSDGVTEAARPDGEEFGEERLAQMVLERRDVPVDTLIDDVRDRIDEFTEGAPPADDITLLVSKRLPA